MVKTMKKEDLVKLGLDEETAKKVADASAEELKGFIPKARFDEVNTEKKNLEAAKATLEGQLESLKNSTGDVEAMKKQIETLQAENKAKDEAHAAEIKQLKIDTAIASALTEAKAKNVKAVKALLDLENAELLEDGTIKGLADQIKKLQSAEDSKFLFETEKKPSFKGAKPGETGKEGPDGAVDLKNMSYDELCAYLEENPDAKI
jgi:small-conductance mechanosensitive channel